MKQLTPEWELISLDRLKILEERVYTSVKDYKTLLLSLRKAFKSNNTDLIHSLQLKESEIIKTLTQRVKVHKAHLKTLKLTNGDINKTLIELNSEIETFKTQLFIDKTALKKEMSQVNRMVKPLGKSREYTAGRIDIIT